MRSPTPPMERFMRFVDKTDKCWIWTGSRVDKKRRYGQFNLSSNGNGPKVMAHRWLWQQENGPVPDGMELDHRCRNTVCVRPDHLEPVTHAENMRRSRNTECSRGHDMTDPKNHVLDRRGWLRDCKVCKRIRERERKRRLRAEAKAE